MRGSMNNQIMCALKAIARIGESRHESKMDHGGMSPYIHSVGTLERTFYRLRPLGQWLREHGVKSLEELTSSSLSMYLRMRWRHHIEHGNARATFRQELSAVAALERGLTVFSQKHREKPVEYQFQRIRKMYSRMARVLPARTSEYEDRAANEVQQLLSSIEEEKHRLMARLQIEAGCRAEGVGAPRKGSNPFTLANLSDPETGELMGAGIDPVTGKQAVRLWTREKGGKTAMKYCRVGLGKRLKRYLAEHGRLEEEYSQYLAVNHERNCLVY